MSPPTLPKEQIAVSLVLGQQCFNTAVFCAMAIVARTKRELKTGDRAILWQGD